ncbi:MAG: hypothetical protein K9J13_09540 [Saprospiraceae bacterium]|nr:hypothetical protein [Saprospiraceae bacterium]
MNKIKLILNSPLARIVNLAIIVIVSFTFSFCSGGKLKPESYINWVETSQLTQQYETEEFSLKLQYRPIDYIIVLEHGQASIDRNNYYVKRKELQGLEYFCLQLTNKHPATDNLDGSVPEQNNLSYYLMDGLQQDISFISGLGTLYPVLYHYEGMSSNNERTNILFAFETTMDKTANNTIQINSPLFSNEIIDFVFNKEILKDIPKLKISKR